MTIFGLNSPELFVLIVITLVILGTKRIEKGIDLFSRLLKFLLSNQSSFDKTDKKKGSIKGIEETKEIEEKISKIEGKIDAKEKDLTKGIEKTQEKNKNIADVNNKEKKSPKSKESKGIVKDKTVKKSKRKNPE